MMYFRKVTLIFFVFSCLVCLAATSDPYSKRMADSQLKRSGALLTWEYPNGLFMESVLKVYAATTNTTYYNYVLNYAKAVIGTSSGKIASGYSFSAYTLDNVNPGVFLMQIYNTEKSGQYKIALDTLRKQLQKQPRTTNSATGGFWHKNSYPNQMWLDGLFMGTRFYAAYEKTFNNGNSYDDIVNQFVLIHSKTYDPVYQLNYHAWSAVPTDASSFWSNQTAPFLGCSKEFWGRGLGWYAAALVDVLEILPTNYTRRQELLTILNQVVAGIKRWQDPVSGCWYQLLRYDNTCVSSKGTHNYLEASSSSMFTYVLWKAIRLGLIDASTYTTTATKAYNGLISNFVTTDISGDISLNGICKSAGLGPSTDKTRDGSIDYYLDGSDAGQIVSNDLKGVGPFILASVEYENWLSTKTGTVFQNQFQVTHHDHQFVVQAGSNSISRIQLYSANGQLINEWKGGPTSTVLLPFNKIKGMYFLIVNGVESSKFAF